MTDECVEPTHVHLLTEGGSQGWDMTEHRGTVYVLWCCASFGRLKIGFTRNGLPGVQRRLDHVRRKRELPSLSAIATVDLGECTEVDGWSREEAMRLWLVHRRDYRWDPWQDWLQAQDGRDVTGVVS